MASNYVSCGVETIVDIFSNYFEKLPNGCISEQGVSDFLKLSSDKFLSSYGAGLNYKTKKIAKNHKDNFVEVLKKAKGQKFFKDAKLYVDSGGFQIANGALETKDIPEYIDMYYSSIMENKDLIDHAFLLDLPVGQQNKHLFTSYEQVHQLNEISYSKCREIIPADIRKDKMIYVHHFRTPQTLKIWNDFLWNKGYAEGYDYLSVGGLVANMASGHTMPILIIALPLINIISYLKKQNKKSFKFHILGGAQFSEVFLYFLYKKHIKKCHDVDIDITYDSSMIFKGLSRGRICYLFHKTGILDQCAIKSNGLHLKFDDRTLGEKLYHDFDVIANLGGFTKITNESNPIYDTTTNTFDLTVQVYLFLHCLHLYKQIEDFCQKTVDDIYYLYENNVQDQFYIKCLDALRKLSKGRTTEKQKIKVGAIWKTLDLMKQLDIEKADHFVEKYMSGDDINNFGEDTLKW